MYFVRTPYLISKVLYRKLTWEIPNADKNVFLTFDDGPHPEVTTEIIKILYRFKIQSTFFCVGENIRKHPDTYNMLIEKGHRTANHTFNHLKGWKTSTEDYTSNVDLASKYIDSKLFRPPYGRIKKRQLNHLNMKYQIIMWTILAGDFDKKVSGEQCYQNVIRYAKTGSIIVFHDSKKAEEKVLYALPKVIEYLLEKKFNFALIPEPKIIQPVSNN